MSQNYFNIANQGFPSFRSDLNSALLALGSNSSGATAPATTYAYQWWYDTGTNILKMRSSNNDAWISISFFDQTADAFRLLDDTQVVNSGGTQVGIIGDQATSTWETGTGTTESLVSPTKIKAAIDTLAFSMPAGTVIHYAANSAPTGFIKANGAAVSRTTYATLFSAIGTTFGVGDGSTTFNVPDLRGEFVRGWDDGRGVDSGRSFGTAQDDQVGEHDHGFVDGRSYIVPRNVAASGRAFGTGAQDEGVVFDALTGQETRPTNVALLACIKF